MELTDLSKKLDDIIKRLVDLEQCLTGFLESIAADSDDDTARAENMEVGGINDVE